MSSGRTGGAAAAGGGAERVAAGLYGAQEGRPGGELGRPFARGQGPGPFAPGGRGGGGTVANVG